MDPQAGRANGQRSDDMKESLALVLLVLQPLLVLLLFALLLFEPLLLEPFGFFKLLFFVKLLLFEAFCVVALILLTLCLRFFLVGPLLFQSFLRAFAVLLIGQGSLLLLDSCFLLFVFGAPGLFLAARRATCFTLARLLRFLRCVETETAVIA